MTMAPGPTHHFKAQMEKKWTQWQILFSWALKSLRMVTVGHEIKRHTPWKESYDKTRQHMKKQRHHFADKGLSSQNYRDSLVAQTIKHLPAMGETWVWSPGQEDPLEKEMATHSSTLAWKIIWMEAVHGVAELDTTERLSTFSQSYVFSSIHVRIWEMDHKEGCVLSRFSRVWLLVTQRIIACQVPLSMGFSTQEDWRELPFPSPIKKADCQCTDAFKLWCWRRLLRIPWTSRRSNQSILKEINPEYSLEGMMLKLKLQCFGHLMQRANSLEKTLMLGKTEGQGEGDGRGWDS